MSEITIAAFYKFVDLPDYTSVQHTLKNICQQQKITGTIILATEGINGTIAARREGIDQFFTYLRQDARFANIEYKLSTSTKPPFMRMKVKLKREIVTLGVDAVNPNKHVGQYVDPKDWNRLISDPEVTVIDTRNHYEYEIGSFQRAITPDTDNFRQLPSYVKSHLNPSKHKKIAMFCTGGIRCEKSTSYLLSQGFNEVYHLKGGILKYLETVPEKESLWQGECFVFDDRVAVNHQLEAGKYAQCHACRFPITQQEQESPHYVPGVSCPKCYDKHSPEQKQRFSERQKQMQLADKRGEPHLAMSIAKAKKRKQAQKKLTQTT